MEDFKIDIMIDQGPAARSAVPLTSLLLLVLLLGRAYCLLLCELDLGYLLLWIITA